MEGFRKISKVILVLITVVFALTSIIPLGMNLFSMFAEEQPVE